MNTENIQLKEGFTVVCVWPGTIITEEEIPEMEQFFLDELGTRVQYLETIETNQDLDNPINAWTGGRSDVFLAIHNDDVAKFAIPRLQFGIRWVEDVYFNLQGHLYPERVKQYVPNYVNEDNTLLIDNEIKV